MSVGKFVTVARLEAGKLKIRDLQHFNTGLAAMRDGEVVVTIAHPKATRSTRLNKLYWAGYVAPFSEHTGYTPFEMHEYFKRRFLASHARRLVIADVHGEVKDDIEIPTLTTTSLTEQEFKDYLRDIEQLALDLDISVGSNRGE